MYSNLKDFNEKGPLPKGWRTKLAKASGKRFYIKAQYERPPNSITSVPMVNTPARVNIPVAMPVAMPQTILENPMLNGGSCSSYPPEYQAKCFKNRGITMPENNPVAMPVAMPVPQPVRNNMGEGGSCSSYPPEYQEECRQRKIQLAALDRGIEEQRIRLEGLGLGGTAPVIQPPPQVNIAQPQLNIPQPQLNIPQPQLNIAQLQLNNPESWVSIALDKLLSESKINPLIDELRRKKKAIAYIPSNSPKEQLRKMAEKRKINSEIEIEQLARNKRFNDGIAEIERQKKIEKGKHEAERKAEQEKQQIKFAAQMKIQENQLAEAKRNAREAILRAGGNPDGGKRRTRTRKGAKTRKGTRKTRRR